MLKTVADKMVDLFLGWKIPATFGPDCYVSFDRDRATANNSWPVGTNIFTADEAKAMIKNMAKCDVLLNEYLASPGGHMYIYNAKVVKIVDADTVDVMVDLGFEVYKKVRTRLAGINAPELNTNEGKVAKAFLVGALPVDTPVIIVSKDYDKYGRSVAVIYQENVNINQMLLDSGYAIPYKG